MGSSCLHINFQAQGRQTTTFCNVIDFLTKETIHFKENSIQFHKFMKNATVVHFQINNIGFLTRPIEILLLESFLKFLIKILF